jgi:hypothetical protein
MDPNNIGLVKCTKRSIPVKTVLNEIKDATTKPPSAIDATRGMFTTCMRLYRGSNG